MDEHSSHKRFISEGCPRSYYLVKVAKHFIQAIEFSKINHRNISTPKMKH